MQYIIDTSDYKHFKLLCTKTGTIQQEFNGAAAANRCLSGDVITLDESGIYLHKRATHPPLVGHLQTLTKTIYGMTSSGTPLYLFTPFNKAYPSMRVGANKMNRTHNYLIVAKVDSWKSEDSLPRANLEYTIGDAKEPIAQENALLLDSSPYWKPKMVFTTSVLTFETRLEISRTYGWESINIDPVGCRDVDDTFSWRQVEGSITNYEISIGIADVDAYIAAGSTSDITAARNAQTIYNLDGRAVRPMLPIDLSEGTLSLLPNVNPKPTVSLLFTFDSVKQEIISPHFALTTTQNNTTYTYETAAECSARSLLHSITVCIQKMVHTLAKEDATDPHIWIQALMVYYNIKAAPHAAIIRAHSAPSAEKLAMYTELVPELAFLANESAKYAHPSTCQYHYGFSSLYCHATSPIRRYSDIVNQRALKASIVAADAPKVEGLLLHHLNQHQKAAKNYQHELYFTRILHNGPHNTTAKVIRVDKEKNKLHLYMSKWNRVIKVPLKDKIEAQQVVHVSFVYNSSAINWKERLVCSIQPVISPK